MLVDSPLEMAESEARRVFPVSDGVVVQPLGEGLFSAMAYYADEVDGEVSLSAVATLQIRAVVVGVPQRLSVALGEG